MVSPLPSRSCVWPALSAGGVVFRDAIAVRAAPGAPKCCAVRSTRTATQSRTPTLWAGIRDLCATGRAAGAARPRAPQRFFSRSRLESADRTVRGGQQVPVRRKAKRADDSSESALPRPVTAFDRNELLSGKARARRELLLSERASAARPTDRGTEASVRRLHAESRRERKSRAMSGFLAGQRDALQRTERCEHRHPLPAPWAATVAAGTCETRGRARRAGRSACGRLRAHVAPYAG